MNKHDAFILGAITASLAALSAENYLNGAYGAAIIFAVLSALIGTTTTALIKD